MIEKDLLVSLEEFVNGCMKKMKVLRKVLDDCGFFSMEEKILMVNVKFGWKVGIKIIFFKEGDCKFGIVFVDVVFIVKDKLYVKFMRDSNNNIIYVVDIFFRDVLIGGLVEVFIIDGWKIKMRLSGIVNFDFL